MQYKEYQPNVLLSPYIETYWNSNNFESKGESHKILPDGCVDIIFMFDKARKPFFASIVGTMTSFKVVFLHKALPQRNVSLQKF
jgi:hypothetical protein